MKPGGEQARVFAGVLALAFLSITALSGCVAAVPLTRSAHTPPDRSEDRAAIHALLIAYGETIDARDFAAFARLFGKEGRYVGGVAGPGAGLRGPQAAEALEKVFGSNPGGVGGPNFHLFFNEVIRLTGPDSATSTSKALFMVPGPQDSEGAGKPVAAMMAGYTDTLVREDGAWTFARREVRTLMPAPVAAPAPR